MPVLADAPSTYDIPSDLVIQSTCGKAGWEQNYTDYAPAGWDVIASDTCNGTGGPCSWQYEANTAWYEVFTLPANVKMDGYFTLELLQEPPFQTAK